MLQRVDKVINYALDYIEDEQSICNLDFLDGELVFEKQDDKVLVSLNGLEKEFKILADRSVLVDNIYQWLYNQVDNLDYIALDI